MRGAQLFCPFLFALPLEEHGRKSTARSTQRDGIWKGFVFSATTRPNNQSQTNKSNQDHPFSIC
jgi:hypothetical protein